jgi:hypothetical protein
MEAKGYWFTPDPKNAPKDFPAGPHPRGFTGKKNGKHYYMGQLVTGPTCLAGCKDQAKIDAWYANRGRTAPAAQ